MAAVIIIVLIALFSTQGVLAESYVVKPGDTLSHIARGHGLSWGHLAEYNNISDPSRIRAGSVIYIPQGDKWVYDFSNRAGYVNQASYDELQLLARLISAEARGESLDGQIAVGAVVLNRVQSPLFPGTIRDVIYQPGQFTPVEKGLPPTASASSWDAARRALDGEDPSDGALFFYNPRITRSPEFWETRPVIKRIGNHNFAI